MSQGTDLETEGAQDVESWLKQFEIKEKFAKQYAKSLEELGIESINDFKYIAEQKDFDDLMNNVKGIRFMDRKKIQTAWKSLHPQKATSTFPTNFVPMDTKEREALETLGKYTQMIQEKISKYEQYVDDSKFLTQQINMIREQVESLKNAIDQRANQLIKQLQTQYNDIKNEYTLEHKKWNDIAIKMHSTKQECNNAFKISDFQQLETRRNTIINSVNETVKIIKVAMNDVSAVDNKKIVVDLEEFKNIEQNIKNIGNVYTHCFEINVTNLSIQNTKLVINWDLKNQNETEVFKSVCNKLKIKIGIVSNDGDDEKKMEQPGDDKINNNIKWIEDIIHNDIRNNKIEKSDTEIVKAINDKIIVILEVDALNNNNKTITPTQCEYFQCDEDRLQFMGYAAWEQLIGMNKYEEDNAMNNACLSKYNGSRAATYKEVFDGIIEGLIKPNSDNWIIFHSGNDDLWKGQAYQSGNRTFCRIGFKKSSYPWNKDKPDHNGLGSNSCQTIAVNAEFSFKKLSTLSQKV